MVLEIVFAAGCFWGVEKNFEKIDGVTQVVSGYAGGNYDNPTYDEVLKNKNLKSSGFISFLKNIGITDDDELAPEQGLINHTEVVKVSYNSDIVSTEKLINNFWEIHDPTQVNGQGNDIGDNYRSALYWTTKDQEAIALSTGQKFQKLLTAKGYGKIVTEIKKLDKFWPAENYHQDYLLKNPNGYCPDHSTGVKFDSSVKAQIAHEVIMPLGGMEILVIEAEEKGSCLYCLQFEKEISSKYKGNIPLRSSPSSALKGFDLKTKTWATPTIFFIKDGKEVWAKQGYMMPSEFYKALGEFKLGKESEAFNVAFNDGTDGRFCKQYDIFKDTPDGVFIDKLSGRPLFDTRDRFNSKTGWLSFTKPVNGETYEKADNSYGMKRTEIRSKSSDIHLGHVFNDGPNGKPRYCINATVLEFVAR
ncbi:peptide-methionine (S)-S-oxide reductase MsrA [Candidatus Thioglobus sp.]|nr:peptide-methionine (S)-S-oxide reductase MsrA [Candidatus Thioglobus sp.]MDC0904132.1 peptide-methionine (S)-S-oxide reductase MsrA [Candidatus Thioglobus sp.]MDC0965172.1 peptide-methionine (S)-S-oxide reductase MsrA [Candidatus Thioglobus sp.]MDC1165933.1 peptide-methionine (S)-S-oxide reductase MsrA [Candidatus Thioglobus sp.]